MLRLPKQILFAAVCLLFAYILLYYYFLISPTLLNLSDIQLQIKQLHISTQQIRQHLNRTPKAIKKHYSPPTIQALINDETAKKHILLLRINLQSQHLQLQFVATYPSLLHFLSQLKLSLDKQYYCDDLQINRYPVSNLLQINLDCQRIYVKKI
jgi:type II secretory pathway component PulM